jgi:hypothetical protein
MFRRNWKAAQLRMRDWRAKEDKKRNDAYLEQVYKERMAQKERDGDEEDDGDEMDWDPIEDVLEDSRGGYVGMLSKLSLGPPMLISSHKISSRHSSGCKRKHQRRTFLRWKSPPTPQNPNPNPPPRKRPGKSLPLPKPQQSPMLLLNLLILRKRPNRRTRRSQLQSLPVLLPLKHQVQNRTRT